MVNSIQNVTNAYQGSAQPVERTEKTENFNVDSAENQAAVTQAAQMAQAQVEPEQASESSIKKAVEDINKKSANMEAIFGYHEGTNRVTIKILDKDTRELKKEYPAEQTLDMIQKVWEMAGLMVDEKR